MEREEFEVRHIASLIAGGATVNGIQIAMLGLARVDNPSTGVRADADEGFAVKQFSVARDARSLAQDDELRDIVDKSWPLAHYLNAAGAIRNGQIISRRGIVKYFANFAGGVHLDAAKSSQDATYKLVDELVNKIGADIMDGVSFELLSIGQAIGQSEDMRALVASIRARSEP